MVCCLLQQRAASCELLLSMALVLCMLPIELDAPKAVQAAL